mgnify:CR=1 FL=1
MNELNKDNNETENNIIKIPIPNTNFWVLGEKRANNKWNLYLTEPGTTRKNLIKENITMK